MLDRVNVALDSLIAYFATSQLLFAVVIGVTITAFFAALFSIASNLMNPVRKQMRDLSMVGDKRKKVHRKDWLESCVMPFRRILLPQSEKEIAQTRHRLGLAGLTRETDLVYFFFSKMALSLFLGVLVLIASTFFPDLPVTRTIFFVCLGFAVGMMAPNFILNRKIEARQLLIINGFPDMLDLLVACSEAGLGLNASIQRVSKEIQIVHPDLAYELNVVNSEILAGVDRIEALKGLSTRTEISDISGFVSMLVQSVRFGTGIADTLRIYAEEFRDKRMQRAEEAAEKVGTKLLFPLVLCMFPCFFVVAVGPAVLSIMKAFAE